MKKFLLTVFVMLASLNCFAKKDFQTVVFTTVPQMHCSACENRIKGNMRFEKGIKAIATNVENQTVTIKYDASKTSVTQLQKGFEKIGYKARLLKAGEKVKANKNEKCDLM